MPFKFFRPWEDGGQEDTLQTPDPRHEASSRPSATLATHHALSVQVVHHGVPSEEATRSDKEEKTHRLDIGDVSKTSNHVSLLAENSLVLPDQMLRRASASGPSQSAGSVNEGSDSTNNETESYARQILNEDLNISCQTDRCSIESQQMRTNFLSSHLTHSAVSENKSAEMNLASHTQDDAGSAEGQEQLETQCNQNQDEAVEKRLLWSKQMHNQEEILPESGHSEGAVSKVTPSGSDCLQTHMETDSRSRLYKCPVCEKAFSVMTNLNNHKRIHTGSRPFKCPVCEKAFTKSSNLRAHERIHSVSKPFKCPVCAKAFTQSSTLHRHERIHTGSKPFKCPVCEKAFTDSSNMHEHKRIHTGSKPFKCPVCQKAFTQSSSLLKHERIHTGSKPFKCPVCEKAFSQSRSLHTHERIHTGSKPFKCPVCEKAFTNSGNLHVHERIHTGSKPFKCTVCEKAFTQSSTLHRHERIHTGSKPS